MVNLRSRNAYRDAAWDWGILDGCFGGKIRPTDVDGLVERCGHFLYLEAKPRGAEIPRGQQLTLDALARQPKSTVLIMWGPVGQPERMVAYGEMEFPISDCKLDDVRRFVSAWFEMANNG